MKQINRQPSTRWVMTFGTIQEVDWNRTPEKKLGAKSSQGKNIPPREHGVARRKYSMPVLSLLILFLPLLAGAVTEDDMLQTTRPELYMRDVASGQISMAPMLETEVQMNISGMISRVAVRQRFRNTSSGWQEGIYVFPLPDTAAVDHMRLWIGERFVEADIEEKQAAEQIYREAKLDGKQAGLVRQERSNVFTTSVANIAPEDEIVVEIEYQQDVHYEQGQFSLRFPMVVAPRYIPGHKLSGEISGFNGTGWAKNTDQVPDASRITPPVTDDAESRTNPVALQINLNVTQIPYIHSINNCLETKILVLLVCNQSSKVCIY